MERQPVLTQPESGRWVVYAYDGDSHKPIGDIIEWRHYRKVNETGRKLFRAVPEGGAHDKRDDCESLSSAVAYLMGYSEGDGT